METTAKTISLSHNYTTDVTLVSNIFIDEYMPAANGSYVKVYLYLLRCITSGQASLTLPFLADKLDNTENDILRALKYWEKQSLITMELLEDGSLAGILLNNPGRQCVQPGKKQVLPHSEPCLSVDESIASIKPPITILTNTTSIKPERPCYTDVQIAELTNSDEIKWLLNIIEIYMERLLKPTDIQFILYLYENLGFSTDLIMHLYDYCVSRNKKNLSYIEAVALSWAADGIDTVEKAEASITVYHENYQAVNKAFGLNRAPGHVEKQYIDKWMSAYGFPMDIITEACSRALLHTGKPDFKYTDKILENWKKKGVRHFNDIAKLDQEHNSRAAAKAAPKVPTQVKASSNRFNAFPQRNYSSTDYSELEQKLLQK